MKLPAPLHHPLRPAATTVAATVAVSDSSPCHRTLAAVSGVQPDYHAFGHLIQHCADHCLLAVGRQLHARLVILSVTPDNFLASKLISFYSRCSRLADARHVFDEIPRKNIFACNSMFLAYAHNHSPFQILDVFSNLSKFALKPDEFSLSALLKCLSSYPSSSTPHEIHGFAIRNGLHDDLFVANGLITAYAKVNNLLYAKQVFEKMTCKDIVSWNSIISGYAQAGHFNSCLDLYNKMKCEHDEVTPNSVTVVIVLQACAQLKHLVFGKEVHRYITERGIYMDNSVWNSIVSFYAKCGNLGYARSLFEEMPCKDGVSYSAMITGYMSYGFVDEAMQLFRQITTPSVSTWNALIAGLFQNKRHLQVLDFVKEMQARGFMTNSVTLSTVLPALSFYSNLLGCKEVHAYALKNNYEQNVYVATALIDTYAKAGHLEGARRVFEYAKIDSVVLWTSIISAYAYHGDAEIAFNLFERMIGSGIEPDSVTFTSVLTACAHSGMVDLAYHIFYTRLNEYGIVPIVEHYACLVGALSRAGMLQEADEFIKKMPFEPNAKALGALLNGAAVAGDVEIGKFAFEQLFEIEPENTGNYILMANIYSRAKKWEEAEKVRERMREVGLVKIPGCSWMETTKGVQAFAARDIFHWYSMQMYVLLEGLVTHMTQETCRYDNELDEIV